MSIYDSDYKSLQQEKDLSCFDTITHYDMYSV